MVERYLQEKLNALTEQLLLNKREQEHLERKLEENQRLIQALEQESCQGLHGFSPREINTKSEEKISYLRQEREKLQQDCEERKKDDRILQKERERLQEVLLQYRLEQEKQFDEKTISKEHMRLKILEALENERKRIAAELHDNSVQELTSIVHKTDLCSKLIQMDPIRCKLELMTMSSTIKGIIEEMRGMIYDLRPMSFDDIGFDVTVGRALEKMNWDHGTQVHLDCDSSVNEVDQVILITLLRIIMEACHNIIKYAKASQVDVSIKKKKNHVILKVIDNGTGFDIEQVMTQKRDDNTGFGLKIMKERVALLSADITFQSAIGEGTSIVVTVPTCKEVK